MYCLANNEWIWEGGSLTSNPPGSWGTKGVASPANAPNGRGGAVGWSDNAGHYYMFGGSSDPFNTMYGDLWQYTLNTNCNTCNASVVLPTPSFQASDSVLCQFDCVTYTDHSSNATSWSWTFPGGTPFIEHG